MTDREPLPSDGPDYHADHAAWVERQKRPSVNPIVNEVVNTGGQWVRPQKVVIPPLFGDESYLVRYVLFRTPWFGVYVHRIDSPDGERHPHNHPRTFWSLILRGGYEEEVVPLGGQSRWRTWRAGSLHVAPLGLFHSIVRLLRRPTWTLLVVGPKRQEWGFATEDGFIPALEYKPYIETKMHRLRGGSNGTS